jgi:hypothetical protein
MRVSHFTSAFFAYALCLYVVTPEGLCYERHQKTKSTLPQGAPLPDVEILVNDRILAGVAYARAKKHLIEMEHGDATEFFERAITALRGTKGNCSRSLEKKIVLEYGLLLRAHMGSQKAKNLEREFGISPEAVEENQEKYFRNFSIKRLSYRVKPSKQKRLAAEQSHGFSDSSRIYLLCKPNERNIVAVLQVADGVALNPDYSNFDYGSIPPLRLMTIDVADALWGGRDLDPANSASGQVERTYELRSTNMNGKTVSKVKFLLDAVFDGVVLKKYRIRSEQVNADWQDLGR